MHGADVVMRGHCLDDAVVTPEFPSDGLAQAVECASEFGARFRAPADRVAKSNVRSGPPNRARLAMVIVAARDDAPVDAQDQLGGDRPVCRLLAQPTVGGIGRPQLPLRMR